MASKNKLVSTVKKTGETAQLTCSNKSCGKVFDKPLIAVNLQKDSNAPYSACPYCLTEIPTLATEIESKNSPETSIEISQPEKKPALNKEETSAESTCKHHLGYLKEKEQKQNIPDECILCAKVIDCMLS